MKVREIAYNILVKIITEGGFSNLLMQQDFKLNEADQRLLSQLVYGTLRNLTYLEYQWKGYVSKMPPKKVGILLSLGCYQLLKLDKIPSYAVLNESVEIAKKIKGGSNTKLVNAILRQISVNGAKEVVGKDEDEILSITTSTPLWLVKMWNAHYGKDVTAMICQENLKDGKVALRVNTLKTTAQELLKDGNFTQGVFENCLYYQGNILASDYYHNSEVLIQGESAQYPVEALKPYGNVLDMCAAPGSKSLQMAFYMQNQGHITSLDLYPHRVELIKENAERYGVNIIDAVCLDATKVAEKYPLESFDCILLDAPCSGLGDLKHKPEIKLTIQPESLDEIVTLQKQLLAVAAGMLKKGGSMVYSTCTLNKKENDRQIEAFLKQHPDFEKEEEKTIFPDEEHGDGFYYVKVMKR